MGSLGMPEILLILVIALIIFGPRKLPELGKSLGQGLAHFRRASEDFKRQWEDEVDIERRRIDTQPYTSAETPSYAHQEGAAEPPPASSVHHEAEHAGEVHETAPAAHQPETAPAAHQPETVSRETGRDWS